MVKYLVLSASLLAACVDTELPGPPYTVEVVSLVGVDAATGRGQYALLPVELSELASISPMYDPAFSFIAAPVIDIEELDDIPYEERAAFVRRDPDYMPRLRDDDGVGVPRDLTTLQVMSAYHAFRAVVADIPALTGRPSDEIIPEAGFQVWVRPHLAAAEGSLELTANAFYISPLDAFGLVGIDPVEKLPVGALQPVLSHEFGHHLFERSFQAADGVCQPGVLEPNAPGIFGALPAIRGFNEGFADLVAYAVTGVANPIADAFPLDTAGYRNVDTRLASALPFAYATREDTCGDSYYCVGTLFARALVEAAVMRGVDLDDRAARLALVRDAFVALGQVPALLRRREWGAGLLPCDPPDRISDDVVSAFAGAFVDASPAEARASMCARFDASFGELGFTAEDRGGCP